MGRTVPAAWRAKQEKSVNRVRNPLVGSGLALEVDDVFARAGARVDVFSAHDPTGCRYLVAHTRGRGKAGTWLCAPVSERALACVRSGQAELRDAFAHSSTGAVDLVTVSTRPGRRPEFHESLRLCCELTDDELPKAGIRFRPSVRCA
jgi:hypothetical protein